MMNTSENTRVHSHGSLKSQEVRSEDANMTSRGNSCVFPQVSSPAHFCEISNGGGFSAVFGALSLVLFRLHRSKFLCIVFSKTESPKFLLEKVEKKTKNFRHRTTLKIDSDLYNCYI